MISSSRFLGSSSLETFWNTAMNTSNAVACFWPTSGRENMYSCVRPCKKPLLADLQPQDEEWPNTIMPTEENPCSTWWVFAKIDVDSVWECQCQCLNKMQVKTYYNLTLYKFLSHRRGRQNCIQHISKTHYDFKYSTCFAKDLIHTINLRHWKYWKSKDIPLQNILSTLWSPLWERHQLKCVKQSKKFILKFFSFS